MPKLGSVTLEKHKTGHYGYSAVKITDLGATEYTLVVIAQDASGSVASFKQPMEKALKEVFQACMLSPRADNLLIRLIQFADNVMPDTQAGHGFKLLQQCNLADYDDCIKLGGSTALVDGIGDAFASVEDWSKQLAKKQFSVNAIVFVITDGQDNNSTQGTTTVNKLLQQIVQSEQLESVNTILIGVGGGGADANNLDQYLTRIKNEIGFTQYVSLADASSKSLARLAAFVSKSISATSQALGSGGVSRPLTI